MDKLTLLKILGVLVGLFLVSLITVYFLYPKINEDKYEKVVSDFEKQKQQEEYQSFYRPPRPKLNQVEDSSYAGPCYPGYPQDEFAAGYDSASAGMDSLRMVNTRPEVRLIPVPGVMGAEEQRLTGLVDSLQQVIAGLETELSSKEEEFLAVQAELAEMEEEMDPAEFSDRVKSLLNLDEDELAPILEKMSQEQLVRLYFGGGTIQREKILRSLKSDKAAKLMTEIM
ncbi:hypothetical protein [Gracilimonas mengyeensis]|uniref:Uncharacterized protein n=1 Tax=Gracilimonas mengyeensis TaxID=1302730 RepID=A0A521EEL3_9BACT|nr:hypothetical protein [Gracilimonas mengyeensis]SMO81610.1 hypothetical protein SAMN06265219_111109 [Gracilimonas mengyeensis]